jgi:hypothetical protein
LHRDTQPGHAEPVALSRELARIVAQEGPDRLTFSQLAAQLHSRAWGGLLFIFAAINVLPLPPGTSAFFALPILLVSAQMLFGRSSPWFPARIERRGVTKQELGRLIGKIEWLELRVERIFKPRLERLTGPTATRIIGLVCFLLALVAAIPVPLFHVAPAAAILIFGLALIYSDGALVIAAVVASVLALVLDALIIGSSVVAISYVTSWLHH